MLTDLEAAMRIILALVLTGVVGAEREIKGHAAGLRTNMLVGLGACLFMVGSELITWRFHEVTPAPDPTRIASTIVTGVGFLGAGVIFQSKTGARNLTTAATIWVVAAIGTLVGAGFYITAIAGTAITMLVLAVLPAVELQLNRRWRARAGRPLRSMETESPEDMIAADEDD